MSEPLWLIPLFFFAIAMGFFLGRREGKRRQRRRMASLSQEYVAGLNFLLNEEPDKAVEALLSSLEVSPQTLETHLSMARLFRKRGEFDRATLIHSHLLESGDLPRPTQEQIQLELAEDYFAGGLFDRAEEVLLEMLDQDCEQREQVTRQLMKLYEQERDWPNAIAMGERLIKSDAKIAPILAQYCCEEAEGQVARSELVPARRTLRRALGFDKECVRASVDLGRLEMREQNWEAAIAAFRRIWDQDRDFFDEYLDDLRQCYEQLEQEEDFIRMLADYSAEHPSTARVLVLSGQLKERYGDREAAKFIAEYMQANPSVRGLDRLIDMNLQVADQSEAREQLELLKQLTQRLMSDRTIYQCRRCGFTTPLLQWRCPSCRRWGTIKPRSEGDAKS
ncbi:tetratricopeptide repeat protein [Alcanivorax balearicus MACL04]|uniref:Lipopolysaccharide assembly protein B n=1 Tax=Alloalcanivorax balearicus MACL04 TaxID=1177182 RepID=A0ABT2R2F2_9GAMM|nr:lipopolysaccharide assembly protein LapB [Alloalcanivorax balearicus]MCU5783951.1 tetratricopeptide repeat protein [Alloalcanivorax balearicus MACL04]